MSEKYMVSMDKFADGELGRKFNTELQKILENVADPETDPKKKRTLTVEVKLSGNDKRELLETSIVVKSKLAPTVSTDTMMIMGLDNNGNIIGNELASGVKDQYFIDSDGDLADDTGDKVVDLRKTQNK